MQSFWTVAQKNCCGFWETVNKHFLNCHVLYCKMNLLFMKIHAALLKGAVLLVWFGYSQLSKPSCSSDASAVMIIKVSRPPRRPIKPTAGQSAKQVATAMPTIV